MRVHSSELNRLPNVAFKTPAGQLVLIALNENTSAQSFQIEAGGKAASLQLDASAVVTCVWDQE